MNYKRMVPNSISGLSLILGVVSIFLTIAHDLITGIITEYGVLIEPYEDMIRQLARKLRRNIND